MICADVQLSARTCEYQSRLPRNEGSGLVLGLVRVDLGLLRYAVRGYDLLISDLTGDTLSYPMDRAPVSYLQISHRRIRKLLAGH